MIVFGLGQFLDPPYMDSAYKQIKAFYALPQDSVDLIAYGSSHTWKGFDSKEFSSKYGISAYNFGCNWQHMNTTHLFFKESLKTQHPKYVLIETFHPELLSDCDMNGEIYYTRYLNPSRERNTYLKGCFGKNWGRYVAYYMPLIQFHENWENITDENFVKLDSGKNIYEDSQGFAASNAIYPVQISNYKDFEQKAIPEESIELLTDIVNTCKQQSIELIFFTLPYEGEYVYQEAFESFAKEHTCLYFNFFEINEQIHLLDPNTDYQDDAHLNSQGAKKIADYLGDYITGQRNSQNGKYIIPNT